MSLVAWLGMGNETGIKSPTPKPINEGTPIIVAPQESASTGFFGWLDDLGAQVGDVAGRAVDTIGGNWIEDLDNKNNPAVKTPDVTPVPSDSKLPVNKSFFEANKNYIMYGGLAVIGVGALIMALRK